MTAPHFSTSTTVPSGRRSLRRLSASVATAVIAGGALILGTTSLANAAALPVPEGTAASYAVLAGSTVTNTNTSTVTGDIGLHPGTSVTGYGPGANQIIHVGALFVAVPESLSAKNAATGAYNNAAAQGADFTLPIPDLASEVLTPGVYNSDSGTFSNSGVLTLDAEGDSSAIFIFQTTTSLITSSGSSVVLTGGASACNVYWQVGSSATLGSGSTMVGTVMADQTITMDSGATLNGRLWALVGAVNLNNNVINNTCAAPTVIDDEDEGDDGDVTVTQVPSSPTGGVATGGVPPVSDALFANNGARNLAAGGALALVAIVTAMVMWRRRLA